MMTMAFTIGLTSQDLKNHFASELRVPSDIIQITLNGELLQHLSLTEIVVANNISQCEIHKDEVFIDPFHCTACIITSK